jgi:protein-tyrosine phosphatase
MKVLMVCLGNICRSPLAEGILRAKAEMNKLAWQVDSAGTSSWHIGETPDKRSIQVAAKYNIDISSLQARQFQQKDLDDFDLILAMDSSNYNDIRRLCANDTQRSKVKLILNYVYPNENRAVPDPYYDGGFEHVYSLLDEACEKIVGLK